VIGFKPREGQLTSGETIVRIRAVFLGALLPEKQNVPCRVHCWPRHKRRFRSPKFSARSFSFCPKSRIYPLSSLVLFCFAIVVYRAPAFSQGWQFVKAIEVGQQPQTAAMIPGPQDLLFVANRGSCNISVINTEGDKVADSIALGRTPKAMVADKSGAYVYVLTEDPKAPLCEPAENEWQDHYWLAVLDTQKHSVVLWVHLPGQRWDDMAIASDGRLFLTDIYEGVYLFDTTQRKLQEQPVISEPPGYPTNLALAEHQNEIFVNFQNGGPGGSPGHDAIGIYCMSADNTPSCPSAYRRIAVVNGIPNVGGPIFVSPDENYVWEYGSDACSATYDAVGCPGYDPRKGTNHAARILNVIDTDSLITRTYGFGLGDDAGKNISFSPELEAYIGGEAGIKVIAQPGVGRPEAFQAPNDATCGDLKNAGDIKFRQAGGAEYMYVMAASANAVCVFERSASSPMASSRSPAPSQRHPGKMYAIVIGINSYTHRWEPLSHPVGDAANVATELREYYGFDVTTLPEDPECKVNRCYVTKREVMDAFENLVKRKFDADDQLLVYITGHGDRWPDNSPSSNPYLVTSDSEVSYPPDQSAAATEVDYRLIWRLLENSSIRHVLFVVDACYAGSYDPTFQIPLLQPGGRPFLRLRSLQEELERDTGSTRKYLSASPFSEQVPDNSVFADKLVEALEKLRTSTAGYFTFENVLTQMASLDPQPRPSSFNASDAPHGDFIFVPRAVDRAERQPQSSLAPLQTH
jgi:YVTN family beta-propeller protein